LSEKLEGALDFHNFVLEKYFAMQRLSLFFSTRWAEQAKANGVPDLERPTLSPNRGLVI